MERITKIEAAQTKKKKLKVAAYARVSTGTEEQLVSLEVQKQHYENYIKSRSDWEYAGLYYDEGISGTKMEKREGLRRLLADCEQGKIDFIVVKSISRFSRNTVECVDTVRNLCSAGVNLYFEKENIDTRKMEGELMLSILSSLAESESRSLSENVRWSMKNRFADGSFKIGYPPYGYDNIEGQMIINQDQAGVVRRIFENVLSGMATSNIAAQLNEDGIKTKRGGKWSAHTINGIIRNEKYVGDVILQKTFTDDSFTRHLNNGERDQYYIRDHHQPIVSREAFEAANNAIDRNAKEKGYDRGAGKYSNRYAFSGKIICGECGCKWKRVKLARYFGYSCTTHIKDRSRCQMMTIPEVKMQGAFVTMMNKLIFGRKQILVPYAETLSKESSAGALGRIDELTEMLEQIGARQNQITQFFAKGLLDPAVYQQERDQIAEEQEQIRSEREYLTKQVNGGSMKEQALAKLLKFTSKSDTLTSFEETLFSEHVDHIVVLKQDEVGFVMKCGPTFKEKIK
jgi:site-specific DNA recombinase